MITQLMRKRSEAFVPHRNGRARKPVILLGLGISFLGFAQQAKHSQSAYLRGPFIQKSPTSLGPGFLGHDIRAVVAMLERSLPEFVPKSEFETSEHYDARLNSLKPAQEQFVFVDDPGVNARPADDYNDAGIFTYDADQEAFSRTIKLSPYDGAFAL